MVALVDCGLSLREDRWQEPFVRLSPLCQLSGAPRLPPPSGT